VGIIGRNGAGKSTLLKILSRITEPTTGQIDLYGRVGSLLEVGTGFHPELTGRENVFLNGAILGMSRREIARQFDAIVEFSGTEQFLDTPVKRYSSGMYVRLAFAVAAHLNPEILIVDEVLAVGDAEFQKKCLGKMKDVSEQEGKTVLFVSHNMSAVRQLCQRAILLENGKITVDGSVLEVVDRYSHREGKNPAEIVYEDCASAPGDDRARLVRIRILDRDSLAKDVDLASPLTVEVEYRVLVPGVVLNLSLAVYDKEDVYVLASPSLTDREWYQTPHPEGTYCSHCTVPGDFLNEGRYTISALLVENGAHLLAYAERAVSVNMVDSGAKRGNYFGPWNGVVRPHLVWQTNRAEAPGTEASLLSASR
jgi:lipopolysaccharide transport system ATP-binding protein